MHHQYEMIFSHSSNVPRCWQHFACSIGARTEPKRLQSQSSADLHRQQYQNIHPGVANPVLLGKFPLKLVANRWLASTAMGSMYRPAMESTPKLRTRYHKTCYCPGMKMASITVNAGQKPSSPAPQVCIEGWVMQLGNFLPECSWVPSYFSLCIFVSLFLGLVSTRASGASRQFQE